MYVKKITSFCQVLKRKLTTGSFFLPHGVQWYTQVAPIIVSASAFHRPMNSTASTSSSNFSLFQCITADYHNTNPILYSIINTASRYLQKWEATLYLAHVGADSKYSIGIIISQVRVDKLFTPVHVGHSWLNLSKSETKWIYPSNDTGKRDHSTNYWTS